MFTNKRLAFVFTLVTILVANVLPTLAAPPEPDPVTITDLAGKELSIPLAPMAEESPFTWLPEGSRFTGDYLKVTGIVRDGKTWVATNWGGLTAFSDDGSWEKAVGLPSERIQWLGVLPLGSSGILTVGSEKGLSFFWSWHDPQEWITWTSADWGGSCDSVTAVAYRQLQDHGEIWLGTESDGVFRYDGGTLQWTNWKFWPRWEGAESQKTISAIRIAEDGSVLVAATYGGAARYYEEDWSFFHDVPYEYAWDIIEWNGQIWIAWGHNYLKVSEDGGNSWKIVSDTTTLTRDDVIGSVTGDWPAGSYKIAADIGAETLPSYVVFEGETADGLGYYTGYWFRPSSCEGVHFVSPALREDLSGGTEVFGATRNLGRGPVSLEIGPSGKLFAGNYADGFSTFDGQTWRTSMPEKGILRISNVQAMAFDDDHIIVGGNGGFAVSKDGGEWDIITVAGGGMPVPGMISDIYVDKAGEVWTATEEGILWFTDGNVQLINEFNTKMGYNDNWYAKPMAAARDQYGRLWIAMAGDSDSYVVVLDEYGSRQFEFEYYSFNSITFDKIHQKVIVGSQGDGLVIFDVGSETISYVLVGEEKLLSDNIRDVNTNAGRIAIATSHGYPPVRGGVSISDDGGQTWQNFPEVGPADLVAVGPDGAVYAAGPTPDPTDDYSLIWIYKEWSHIYGWMWKSFGITTAVRSLAVIGDYHFLLGTDVGVVRWDIDEEFRRWPEVGIVTAIDCGDDACWLSSWQPGFYDEEEVWHEDKSHLLYAATRDLLPTPPIRRIYLPIVLKNQ